MASGLRSGSNRMAAGESRDPESDNTLSNQTDEDNDFEISEMAEDAKSVLRRSLGSQRTIQESCCITGVTALYSTQSLYHGIV